MDYSRVAAAVLLFGGVVALAVLSPLKIDVNIGKNDEARQTVDHTVTARSVDVDVNSEVFVVVEQMPELVGGLESIQPKLQYPEEAKAAGHQGRVFLQFVVNRSGEVEEISVIRGVSPALDAEALRVVSKANFIPGKQRGQKVRVKMTLPVTFRL